MLVLIYLPFLAIGLWAALRGGPQSHQLATVWLSYVLGIGLCVMVVMFGSSVGQGMTAAFGLAESVATGESELLEELDSGPDYVALSRQSGFGNLMLFGVVVWNAVLWRGEHVRRRQNEELNA